MSNNKVINAWDWDIRVRERNLRNGVLTDKDLEKARGELPDLADQAEPVTLAQPALDAEEVAPAPAAPPAAPVAEAAPEPAAPSEPHAGVANGSAAGMGAGTGARRRPPKVGAFRAAISRPSCSR